MAVDIRIGSDTRDRDESEAEQFRNAFLRGFASRVVQQFIDQLMYPPDDEWQEELYESDPKDRLKQCIVTGQQILIRGVTGVGKTNLIMLIFEIALERGWSVACNVRGVEDERILFINNFRDLKAWLKTAGPKLFAFDDATLFYSSRRSMQKGHENFRKLHALTSKRDCCFVWVEHVEKMVDIDVRRFAAWTLEKPYQQLGGITDTLDGQIKLWVKRVIWVWRRGELGQQLRWWSNQLPKSVIQYSRKIFGDWKKDDEDEEEYFEPPSEEVIKVAEGQSFRDYVLKRTEAISNEHAEVVRLTFEGRTQIQIAEDLYGNANLQGKVSLKLRDIHEKHIGYWYEDWWREKHGLPYIPDNEKNTPRPDVFLEDHPEYGEVYITLKTKWSKLRMHTYYPERDFAPELKAAREKSHNVIILALANPLLNKYIEEKINAKETPERIRVKC